MKFNTKTKRIISIVMFFLIIVNGILAHFSFATNSTTIEKISNPNSGEGEADGITPGGDREASYAWAMTTRGDYVYVGTNKNVIGGVAEAIVNTMVEAGATQDQAWAMVNLMTNNEIPRPTTTVGGEIFKCNIKTGEITKIYTADPGVAFRMAIEFDGDLYFGSYSSDITATNYIYKIDENDQITQDFVSEYGTSMRAACIHNDELYFGGVDSRYELAEGYEDYAKIAIIKKTSSNDEWNRVADYKDFGEYSNDLAVKNTTTSPIWDICSYDGYIYATLPNTLGLVMFRGHPAEGNEQANEYGWYWEEVIGKNSQVNNIGMAETAAGQIGDNIGLISACATPFVFKDKLYLMNFDNTIQAEITGVTGLLAAISNQTTENEPDLTEYLKPMYTTLKNPQLLWVYDDTTGKFNEVSGFSEFMKDTCNEYLWRTEIYNDELYISTMDSAVLYNWVLQFTGEHFTRLTADEIDISISNIDSVISTIQGYMSGNSELIETLEQTKVMLNEYKQVMNDSEKFNDFVVKYEDLIIKAEEVLEALNGYGESISLIPGLTDLLNLSNEFDWDALRMYAYIVRMVENDTWGFDLLKTSDGENFEIVTDSGFEDKYNYGGRSMITTNRGLYLGTANPFYGAQLWRIQDPNTVPPDNPTPDDPTPDNPTPDNPTPDDPTPDNPTPDNPTPDDPTPDNPTPDNPTPDDPTPNNPNQNTGATKEELDEIKQQLNTIIQNQEKFEEELNKLKEDVLALKNNKNQANNKEDLNDKKEPDNTTIKGEIPKTGKAYIIVAVLLLSVATGVIAIRMKKYKEI